MGAQLGAAQSDRIAFIDRPADLSKPEDLERVAQTLEGGSSIVLSVNNSGPVFFEVKGLLDASASTEF